MAKQLRVLSVNFPFSNSDVRHTELEDTQALFDADVVVIRPAKFQVSGGFSTYQEIDDVMSRKRSELARLMRQGGLLVIVLDTPDSFVVETGGYSSGTTYTINNYAFLDTSFAYCLRGGKGTQITYTDQAEPFVAVLKKSKIAWTAYIASQPPYPFNDLRYFASAGQNAAVGARSVMGEGHLILLPNLQHLDEPLFFDVCAEYRFSRQGSRPPDWVKEVSYPGSLDVEKKIATIDAEISKLQSLRSQEQEQLEKKLSYKKLLYEKGKVHLEPIAISALNHLGFGATPSEVIPGTSYEIDGRTSNGSTPGLIEIKGSRNQIAFDEFSPIVIKLVADQQSSKVASKGILIGNGMCESLPASRLGDSMFTKHVLDAARRNSVALISSVELYWLCCTLAASSVDLEKVRETILKTNGYVDLTLFCGASPWP